MIGAARRLLLCAVCAWGLSTAGAAVPTAAPTAAATAAHEIAEAEQAYQTGDLPRAEKLYAAIIEARGDDPMAWFRLGLIHQRRQSFRAALTAYDNALTSADVDNPSGYTELRAKIRFNRALLLLESAAADIGQITPGVLEPGRDLVRGALAEHLNASLLAAGSEITVDPPKAAVRAAPAESYVYEAPEPVAPARVAPNPGPQRKTP